ncbi:MAG TPA: SDR family oxidoreductase [Candidatus Dormibacteraeota bacterium]|jgi:NAD(P)-dependent dehydrogenase (short-subunit alcohol dehydrogenase family)|nr:SDR family oxidoreductase [Candidatus Dormibacteraeota bacterium]
MGGLSGKRVLIIGRGSGIAGAAVLAAKAEGADVVAAGRDAAALASHYEGEAVSAETVDVTDEESIARLAATLGRVDHVVTTASARARGKIGDLQPETVALSFAVKAIGPILLAKHLAPIMPADGSFVLFSGATAVRPQVGMLAVAGTNGAVDSITRGLAVELAPIRVNAIAPGTIDSGAYEALGAEARARLFSSRSATSPSGRVGEPGDIARAVIFALTASFLTGVSIRVDGGEILV